MEITKRHYFVIGSGLSGLDMAQVAAGRFDFDVTGHYARPDVFHFWVNQEEQLPVDLGEE